MSAWASGIKTRPRVYVYTTKLTPPSPCKGAAFMFAMPPWFQQWSSHWIKEVARQEPRRIQSMRPNVEMLESRHLPSSWSTGNLMASTASPATSTEGNYAQFDSTQDASSQTSSTQGKCTGGQSAQSSSSTWTSTNSTWSSSTQGDCMQSNSASSTSTQESSTSDNSTETTSGSSNQLSSGYRSMDGAGNNLANPRWGTAGS